MGKNKKRKKKNRIKILSMLVIAAMVLMAVTLTAGFIIHGIEKSLGNKKIPQVNSTGIEHEEASLNTAEDTHEDADVAPIPESPDITDTQGAGFPSETGALTQESLNNSDLPPVPKAQTSPILPENIQSPASSEGGTKTIVCVGDSITRGDGVETEDEAYPGFLRNVLGEGYDIYNKGVDGVCLIKSGEFPYPDTGSYPDSKALNGDIYIIMLGTNDTRPGTWDKEAFKKEYFSFVEEYLNLPSRPVVYIAIPPKAHTLPGESGPYYDISDSLIRNDVASTVRECADRYGLRVLDLYSVFENHPEWYTDGIHPNATGYRQLANYIAAAIT